METLSAIMTHPVSFWVLLVMVYGGCKLSYLAGQAAVLMDKIVIPHARIDKVQLKPTPPGHPVEPVQVFSPPWMAPKVKHPN